MCGDATCSRCLHLDETISHCIRDCDEVRELWAKVIHPDHYSKFFSLGLYAWIDWNLTNPNVGITPWDWSLFFGVACSMLWNDRNSWVFNKSSKMGPTLFYDICGYVRFIDQELKKLLPSFVPHGKREVYIMWKPPPCRAYKVNVDGSHYHDRGSTACGGLIRNSDGIFVKGFYCNMGCSNPFWAEMWALLLGVRLAQSLALPEVLFELDSLSIVQTVKRGYSTVPALQPILVEILSLLRLPDWKTSVMHTFREANRCADLLANMGHGTPYNWTLPDTAPPSLCYFLFSDNAGFSSARSVV